MTLLDDLVAKQEEIQRGFFSCFAGVNVRVDKRLRGNEYYIAISPEIHKQLKLKGQDKEKQNDG